jgi:uncharacterized protein YmfQ (DUF2313 family)
MRQRSSAHAAGPCLDARTGSQQAQFALAMARSLARVDAAAEAFLANSLPGDNTDLLAEWEETLGLTNATEGLTTTQRSAQVRARFIAGSGPSLPFLTTYAAQLGFTCSFTRYVPAQAGIMTAGGAVYTEEWCSAIGVTVEANANGLPPSQLIAALLTLSAHIAFFLIT